MNNKRKTFYSFLMMPVILAFLTSMTTFATSTSEKIRYHKEMAAEHTEMEEHLIAVRQHSLAEKQSTAAKKHIEAMNAHREAKKTPPFKFRTKKILNQKADELSDEAEKASHISEGSLGVHIMSHRFSSTPRPGVPMVHQSQPSRSLGSPDHAESLPPYQPAPPPYTEQDSR